MTNIFNSFSSTCSGNVGASIHGGVVCQFKGKVNTNGRAMILPAGFAGGIPLK